MPDNSPVTPVIRRAQAYDLRAPAVAKSRRAFYRLWDRGQVVRTCAIDTGIVHGPERERDA